MAVTIKNAVFWDLTLVTTDVSEERFTIIRVTRIGDVGTTLPVTNKRSTLQHAKISGSMPGATRFSEKQLVRNGIHSVS
jgi:hypothetical protein